MNFFEYLREKLSDKIIIEPEIFLGNKYLLPIVENKDDAGLKKVNIYFDKKDLEILAITLDENNIVGDNRLFSYFKRTLCNSSDAVLLVRKKGIEDELYIFYVELKTSKIDNKDILKKHIFSQKIISYFLEMIYYRNIFDKENIDFPTKIYESMIVFVKSASSRELKSGKKSDKNFSEYHIEDWKGEYKNKLSYCTEYVVTNSEGETIRKIQLSNYLKNSLKEKIFDIENYIS